MRECSRCHETKNLNSFGPSSSRGSGGYSRWCRECANEYQREYRRKKGITGVETSYMKAQKSRDSEESFRVCANCGNSYPLEDFIARIGRKDVTLRCIKCRKSKKNPSKAWMWTRYRLREEDYLRMLEAQGGTCAICKELPERGFLVVDHDHNCCSGSRTCGKCVRGLLCDNCNQSISVIEKFPEQVSSYLRR